MVDFESLKLSSLFSSVRSRRLRFQIFEPVEAPFGRRIAALVEVLLEMRDLADFLGDHGGGDGADRGLSGTGEVQRADLGAARATDVDG